MLRLRNFWRVQPARENEEVRLTDRCESQCCQPARLVLPECRCAFKLQARAFLRTSENKLTKMSASRVQTARLWQHPGQQVDAEVLVPSASGPPSKLPLLLSEVRIVISLQQDLSNSHDIPPKMSPNERQPNHHVFTAQMEMAKQSEPVSYLSIVNPKQWLYMMSGLLILLMFICYFSIFPGCHPACCEEAARLKQNYSFILLVVWRSRFRCLQLCHESVLPLQLSRICQALAEPLVELRAGLVAADASNPKRLCPTSKILDCASIAAHRRHAPEAACNICAPQLMQLVLHNGQKPL